MNLDFEGRRFTAKVTTRSLQGEKKFGKSCLLNRLKVFDQILHKHFIPRLDELFII